MSFSVNKYLKRILSNNVLSAGAPKSIGPQPNSTTRPAA